MENKKYDVFISYSSHDQKIAEGICGYLESNGYRCFVAYRDIPRGVVWAVVIPDAINNSAVMVVVFSNSFNIFPQTDREIALASDKIPILTYRISDDKMTGVKEFYLKILNWIDAFPNPEDYFGNLLESVKRLVPKDIRIVSYDIDMPNTILETEVKESIKTENTEANTKLSLDCDFWHFAMLGAEEQIQALRNGVYELNLIEYEEEWRTNLIKQVKENDLVFLFRSGGWGYMGVYRAIGWRIFEFLEGDKVRETLNLFGKPIETIEDGTQILEDLKQSDIYHSKEDGADLCSSLIVEPLAFAKDGIGNPGGVYRRTISRYDHEYGLMQLSRFMAIMDDPNIYDVHYNGETTVRMGCNKELFEELLKGNNILPAEKDKNGNWI